MSGATSFGGAPSSAGSRPLPVPSPPPSRVISDFQPVYLSPSEVDPEHEPTSHTNSYPDPPSERREEPDWEPEENMTIGPSVNEYFPGAPEPIPEDAAEQYTIPEEGALDVDFEAGAKPKGRARHFVGGFVASLRRLPNAVMKSTFYDRSATRRGAPGTGQLTGGPSNFYLPAYDDPGTTVEDPSNVQYVGAVNMPTAQQKSPTDLSPVDPSRRSSHPSRRTSHGPMSHRSSSHAHTTNSVIVGPRFVSADAVNADLQPTSDYRKMESPIRVAPPDDSFGAHVNRATELFHNLKNLPWTSDRVALDYVPTQSNRACTGKAKTPSSWYTTTKHQEIDLLAPALHPSRHANRLRSEDGGTNASIRSAMRIPPDGRTSYMTSPGLASSSSHAHGQNPLPCNFYFSPPTPLYVYTSPMTSPVQLEGGADVSPHAHAQAVPVFMMPGPPPGLLPTRPPPAHTGEDRGRSPRVTVSPMNVPLPHSPMPLPTHLPHSGST